MDMKGIIYAFRITNPDELPVSRNEVELMSEEECEREYMAHIYEDTDENGDCRVEKWLLKEVQEFFNDGTVDKFWIRVF